MSRSAQRGRHVLFVNRFYWPDHSATAQMLTDLAVGLASRGWGVTVLASRLSYDGGGRLPARETHRGVDIRRVRTTSFGRASLPGRALDYASFYVAATLAAVRLLRPGDIVVAKTDPPLIQIPLSLVARLRKARQVNWMQDVYPELAEALGVRAVGGTLARLLRVLRTRSLRSTARTVAIGSRMRDLLADAGTPGEALAEIHNWSDDAVLAANEPGVQLRGKWGFAPDRLVVAYSGNLGRAHDLDTILDAAALLARQRAAVEFLFIGGGALRDRLDREPLPNLHLRPYQPREALPQSLRVADLHWLSLRPELEGLIVPSKFYGAAASGRPLLFIGAADGEIARLIDRYDCGWVIAPGQSARLAALLAELADHRGKLIRAGRNARRMVAENFTREMALAKWEQVLGEVPD